MKLQEIYNTLNQISPFELQEKWDNSGLMLGDMNREVSQIILSLDMDLALIEKAEEGTLFVVHHPLIFGKLTELDFAKYPSNLIEKMILKKHSLIAMHTNFDKTHLNRYVFEKVLGFKMKHQNDFICMAEIDYSYKALLKHIKEKFNLPTLKVVGKREHIGSIALTTGAGASLIDEVEADCFLTGDIKYHDAMKAMSENLMMVDIGHYESEKFFAQIILDELKVLPILAIIANSKNPFHIETL
ncbi:MAG: Nif3-like dinuclear metal center hexameric protein [Campylobacterota bacterium]|nr:Nif3-like dinuclear metal center hexameric protein [Campylobacterota bacterium]